MCKQKGTKNLITAETLLKSRILKARKGNVNGLEAKAKVETTKKYIVMQRLKEVRKDVMKKKAYG